MNKVFKYILCFLFVVVVCCNLISVKASTTVTMTEGVSVRTSGDNGLKFQATVSDVVDGASYGMLFVRGIYTDFDKNTSGVVSAEVTSLNAGNEFCVTMVKFPSSYYGQNISVRAYVRVGDSYTYSNNIVTCNLYEKAVKIKSLSNYVESELIEEIVNNTYIKFMVYTGINTSLHSNMVESFLEDFNTYNNLGISSNQFFAYTYGRVTSSSLYAFFNTSTYASKWKWMFNYINEVRAENGKTALNETINYAYFRADIHCFINLCDPADINNYGVDFRNRDDYRYYFSGKAPYQLPVIEQEGYSFVGWNYDNTFNKDTVSYATSLSPLYAQFKGDESNVEVNVNLELNGGLLTSSNVYNDPYLTTTITKYGNNYAGTATLQYLSPVENNLVDGISYALYHEKLILKYIEGINAYEIIGYYKSGSYADLSEATHVLAKSGTLDFTASSSLIGKYIIASEKLITEGDVNVTLYIHNSSDFTTYNKNLIEETILPIPYKEGYNFGGWYDNSSFTGSSIDSFPGYSNNPGDITYYAKWVDETGEIPHEHDFVEGKCECGEVDPDYVAPDEFSLEYLAGVALGYISDTATSNTVDTLLTEEDGVTYKYTSSNSSLYIINSSEGSASVSKVYQTHKNQNVTVSVTASYNGETITKSKTITISPVLYNDMSDNPIGTYFVGDTAYTYTKYNSRYQTNQTFFSDEAKETLDLVYYAFASPNSDGTLTLDSTSYVKYVTALKENDVRVLVSLNGATTTEQINFYNITNDDTLLNTFINNICDLVEQYNFDGVDIDWEYNTSYPIRSAYYTKLVTGLYNELANRQDNGGTPYMLTAALPASSWGTSTDRFDYTVLNTYLDHINVMSYGMYNSSITSHVSPLYTSSYAYAYGFSMDYAVNRFVSLGFPASKLILGCAGYGTHFTITGDIDETAKYVGLGVTATLSNAGVTGAHNSGTIYSHGIDTLKATGSYDEIHAYNSSGKFVGSYLLNKTTKSFVTYDSFFSLSVKYDYVTKIKGLGLMCWSYTQDTNDTVINGIINAKNNN